MAVEPDSTDAEVEQVALAFYRLMGGQDDRWAIESDGLHAEYRAFARRTIEMRRADG